jgi:hypothetical protein
LYVPRNPRGVNTFAEHAQILREHGLAPIPLNGKQPLIKRFNTWQHPPSQTAIAKLVAQFPNADVGYVAGASGLVVFDADDADAATKGRDVFGDTPVSVRTRRGVHLLYEQPRDWPPRNINLRTILGINGDVKAGAGVLVAPASRFSDGSGSYEWLGEGLDGLRHLPEFPVDRLPRLAQLAELRPRKVSDKRPPLEGMRDGSRGLWLNDELCKLLCPATFDALLDVAGTLNASLADPLDESEVVWRTKQVWRDFEAGKIKPKATEALWRIRGGRSALTLDAKLREIHGPHDEFGLTPKGMAKAQVIPGWSPERYRRARDLLIEYRLLVRLSPYWNDGRNHRARYTFGRTCTAQPPWEAAGTSRRTWERHQK